MKRQSWEMELQPRCYILGDGMPSHMPSYSIQQQHHMQAAVDDAAEDVMQQQQLMMMGQQNPAQMQQNLAQMQQLGGEGYT